MYIILHEIILTQTKVCSSDLDQNKRLAVTLTQTKAFGTDLDPGEEDHDGDGAVEDDLPVGQELEVGVVVGVLQQLVQLVVHFNRPAVDNDNTLR